MKLASLLSLGVICLLSAPALAQEPMQHDHAAMRMAPAAPADVYAPAMEKMHKDMMVTLTGNADVDFVRGMIPHHQGAIDMAKTLKEHGKDPELQKLADDIIAAQEKEIAFMKSWLAKHEGK